MQTRPSIYLNRVADQRLWPPASRSVLATQPSFTTLLLPLIRIPPCRTSYNSRSFEVPAANQIYMTGPLLGSGSQHLHKDVGITEQITPRFAAHQVRRLKTYAQTGKTHSKSPDMFQITFLHRTQHSWFTSISIDLGSGQKYFNNIRISIPPISQADGCTYGSQANSIMIHFRGHRTRFMIHFKPFRANYDAVRQAITVHFNELRYTSKSRSKNELRSLSPIQVT